ncbi:MAG: hypothetical protein Q7S92_03480 [Candidatus Diapherotrites archaeon]|nr:hypothetical protein [Candidatus Diapherotrites archaeon]
MKKLFLVLFFVLFSLSVFAGFGGCNDYCYQNIHYIGGQVDPVSNDCVFEEEIVCEYGCTSGQTSCVEEREALGCLDYCENNVFYSSGKVKPFMGGCFYWNSKVCNSGCNTDFTACSVVEIVEPEMNDFNAPVENELTGFDAPNENVSDTLVNLPELDQSFPEEETETDAQSELDLPAGNELEEKDFSKRLDTLKISAGVHQKVVSLEQHGLIRSINIVLNETVEVTQNGLLSFSVGSQKLELEQNLNSVLEQQIPENETVTKITVSVENNLPIYAVEKTVKVKLLWFIPLEISVVSKVNAETLAEVSTETPWWSFLTVPDLSTPAGSLDLENLQDGLDTNSGLPCPEIIETDIVLPVFPVPSASDDCSAWNTSAADINAYLNELEKKFEECNSGLDSAWAAVGETYADLGKEIDDLPYTPATSPIICDTLDEFESSSSDAGIDTGQQYMDWLKNTTADVQEFCNGVAGLIEPLADVCEKINISMDCTEINTLGKQIFHNQLASGLSSAEAKLAGLKKKYTGIKKFGFENFKKYFTKQNACSEAGENGSNVLPILKNANSEDANTNE